MTKAELIEKIARSRDLPPEMTKKNIGLVLDLAFSEMASYFQKARVTRNTNPRFTFPGFGTFTKKKRSARKGVNPRTLEPIEIEACFTLDFKPAASLKRAMNEKGASAKSTANRSAGSKSGAQSSSKGVAHSKAAKATTVTAGATGATGAAGAKKAKKAKKSGTVNAATKRRRPLMTREQAEIEALADAQAGTLPDMPESPMRRADTKPRKGGRRTG